MISFFFQNANRAQSGARETWESRSFRTNASLATSIENRESLRESRVECLESSPPNERSVVDPVTRVEFVRVKSQSLEKAFLPRPDCTRGERARARITLNITFPKSRSGMANYYQRYGSGNAVVVNYSSVLTAGPPFLAEGRLAARRRRKIPRRSTRLFFGADLRIYRSAGKRPRSNARFSCRCSFITSLDVPTGAAKALSQRPIVLKDVSSRPARAARGLRLERAKDTRETTRRNEGHGREEKEEAAAEEKEGI